MPPNGARLPEVENYNVGIQQALWGGIVVDASYVGTQSHHMYNGHAKSSTNSIHSIYR